MRRLMLVALLALTATAAAQDARLFWRSGVPDTATILTITTTSFSDATEDVAYGPVIAEASGGGGGNEWDANGAGTCAGGSCALSDADTDCAGLSIVQATGAVGGTPTDDDGGTCSFTLRVTDDLAATDTQAFTITVIEAAAITCPSPWSLVAIGSGMTAGTCEETSGEFTVTGAGQASGTADQQTFVYQSVTTDFEMHGQITSCTQANSSTKRCGVEARASLSSGGIRAFCGHQTDGTPFFTYRTTTDGATDSISGTGAHPYVRIIMDIDADTAACYYGDDGAAWTQLGTTQSMVFPSTSFVGFSVFTSASQANALATMVIEDVVTDTTPDSDDVDFGGYRPHLQGFGVTTTGGRGGTVIRVNSLLDNGDGSNTTLREALQASGCRFVVFEVSGTIALASRIDINHDCLTIAGQTAPSPGILIRNHQLRINAHDVVIQHIRMRMGDSVASIEDCIWLRGDATNGNTYNVIMDHVSLSWCRDEAVGVNATSSPDIQDIGIHDSILAEVLNNPSGGQPNHSRGVLHTPNAAGTSTMMRNLMISIDVRNPSARAGWRIALINNIVYNFNGVLFGTNHGGTVFSCFAGETSSPIEAVVYGSRGLPGPNTSGTPLAWKLDDITLNCPTSQFYFEGNTGQGISSPTGDNQWTGVYKENTTQAAVRIDTKPSWYTAFNFHEISNASTAVTTCIAGNAGAWPTARDSVDTRLITEFQSGGSQGAIVETNPTFPTIAENTQTYTTPSNPNDVAVTGPGANGVRTNIEVDLETKARAIESLASCGF